MADGSSRMSTLALRPGPWRSRPAAARRSTVADGAGGVALGQAEQLEELEDLGVLRGPVDASAAHDLAADEDVLRHGELGEQLRLW